MRLTEDKMAWGAIALLAILLTLKYFTGLENEDAYGGLSYQAIYPHAMAGDVLYGSHQNLWETSYRLSAYYLFPKLLGEIWLDDRFIAIIYLITVFISVAIVDRIAVALGIRGLAERLLVLVMVGKDHSLIDNTVLLAHHPDFNHSALAIPLALLVIYLAVLHRRLVPVLVASFVLTAVSIKNAPLPVAGSLAVVSFLGDRRWERIVARTLFCICLAASCVVAFYVVSPPPSERLLLWDHLSREFLHWGNVFDVFRGGPLEDRIRYVGYGVFCMAVLMWPIRATLPLRSVRIFVAMSFVIWVGGCLYLYSTPDALKVPTLLPFSFTSRMHEFVQIVGYIALTAMVLRWWEAEPTPRRASLAIMTLALMFYSGPGNFGMWAATMLICAAASGLWILFASRAQKIPPLSMLQHPTHAVPYVAGWLGAVLAISLIGTTVTKNLSAWITLARHGVYGDSSTAPWIEISDYVRTHTPETAPILAYVYNVDKSKLEGTRSLATRTGRPMSMTHRGTHQFKADIWILEERQRDLIRDAGRAWLAGDADGVACRLKELAMVPHYIILPEDAAAKIKIERVGYTLEKNMRGFVLLRGAPISPPRC